MLVIVITLLFQPQSHISTEWPGDTVNEDKQGHLCCACVEELQHNWHCFFLPRPLQFHISVWLRPSVVCKYRMWHSALIQAQPRLTHRAGSGAERRRYVLLWVLSVCHRAPPGPLITLPAEDESWLGLPQGEEAPGSCRKPGVSAEEVAGGSEGAGQQARLAGRGAGDVAHAETPLASRVNTDDFSVCPYELTLLGETQEEGRERWQCQRG